MNDLTIYHKKILELASVNRKSLEINDFNFSKEVKNPLCGDLVEVRVKILNDSVKNLSAKVKGCALCEASAGVVVNYFLNKNLPTNNFMEYFDSARPISNLGIYPGSIGPSRANFTLSYWGIRIKSRFDKIDFTEKSDGKKFFNFHTFIFDKNFVKAPYLL